MTCAKVAGCPQSPTALLSQGLGANSPAHNGVHRVFLKFMVNDKQTTSTIYPNPSDPRKYAICRCFVSHCLDCRSRTADRTRVDRALCINRRSRYRVTRCDRGGEMWLKRQGPVDTLCRGEVAEWLNAAVSKTVTSVIPASGVRIPPSPRFRASQHAAAFGFRLSARSGL